MDMDTDMTIVYAVCQRGAAQDSRSSSNGPGDGVWFSLHFELQQLTRSPIFFNEEGDNAFEVYDHHCLQTTIDRLLGSKLLDGDPEVISLALLSIGVPIDRREPIIEGIRKEAHSMSIDPTNAGHNLLHMEVSICMNILVERRMTPPLDIEIELIDTVATVATESFEDQPLYMSPATESSIEALERVTIYLGESTSQCTICMEEILQGTEANKMPCSHIYHKGCIREWLHQSHTCPLCRFPMPSMRPTKSNLH